MTNWAANVVFGARSVERPTSIDAVRALVARSDRIRALGTAHSFSTIADTAGVHVTLDGLPRVIEIDTAACRVRVGAAVRYGELAPVLDRAGLALHNLASLPHISIAGACATGTHGSGTGNLATAVSSLQLVTASGDVVTLRRGDADFDGTVVALGAIGVVTALTLDVVPTFQVAQYVYDDLADDALDEHFDAIFDGGYSVSVFTDLEVNRIWCKRMATDPAPQARWFGAVPAAEQRHPVPGMPAGNCTQQLGVPGPWYQRLPHFRLEFTPSAGAELQSEYLLPRSNAVEALHAVRGLRALIRPVLQIAEIRTVVADELWLSPSYRRATVGVHFTWVDDAPAVLPVVEAVERALAPFAPRPHWGKVFRMAPSGYERLADFRRLAAQYDPAGKFGVYDGL